MIEERKKSVQELEADKAQKIMETVAWRAGFYRANPHRFVEEVLEIHLKLFQKILLYVMMHYNYIMYLAARGRVALLHRNMQVIKNGKSVKAKY